ncbi:MAG: putative selenate reductase subunit YgfK, partial [Candidatus Cloacimonetes bacterium]|nr:putative selenate reductase subunit YgfK [Candidatus Cloacimonadota bacterium]
MSDIMIPVEFRKLLNWILAEYKEEKTIFGIPEIKFYKKSDTTAFDFFGEKCETPIGPAAGPHTQSTPNIIAAYLTGSRFFELKTVQILDELDIEKPCIEATDEGYNTEWSTELTVTQAYGEYVKAWFLLHVLNKMFGLSKLDERAFIFNMSVGYDIKGIKSPKIDKFIEELKDASGNEVFQQCKKELKEAIKSGKIPNITDAEFVETISPKISNSITLSTMHGCPPEDQEAICKYFISEKKMHTFVKLNPTLHGYEYVKNVFEKAGYDHITLKEESFTHDMQYPAAVKMLHTLIDFAEKHSIQFGVKLSNTLAVKNDLGMLPTDEMYMSGRTLYPLTINLARKLSEEFDGKLPISYSGGADYFNIKDIFETGIRPITMATNLLKPGGYSRLTQIAELLDSSMQDIPSEIIDLEK